MVVLNAHCTLPPPDLNGFDVNLPKAVVAVLTGALAKKPDERYQTAGAAPRLRGESKHLNGLNILKPQPGILSRANRSKFG